jgi:vitamin B12 transporter
MRGRIEFLLVLLLPCVCWAAGEPAHVDSLDRFAVYEMEGITVTATRVPDRLADVPIGTQVITGEEIEASGARDAGDLLRSGVGLEVRDYGATGSVSSMSIRGSTSSQVLVLVDGRPTNSVSLGIADLSEVSLVDARKVEVVRGPASSLYGANALGGVVNIITGPATAVPYLRGTAEFGSYGREFYSGRAASLWKGLGFSLSTNWRSADGIRKNSDYDGRQILARLSYEGIQWLEPDISAGFEWFELGLPGPVPEEGEIPNYGNADVTSLLDRQENSKGYVNLSLKSALGDAAGAGVKFYYDRRDMNAHLVYDSWDSTRLDEDDKYLSDVFGANLQLDLSSFSNDRMVVGLDAMLSKLDASYIVATEGGAPSQRTEWTPADTVVGLYVENQWRPVDILGLTASGRYDRSEAYGSRVSPSVGIVLNPVRGFRVKASIGEAFRAPTLNDLYWPESAYAGGNPDLKPETGVGSEIRLEYGYAPVLEAAVSFLKRDVRDMIEWGVASDGKWRPINVNEFHSTGAEAELRLVPHESVELSGNYTFIYAFEETDLLGIGTSERRAAYRPKASCSCGATYKSALGFDFLVGVRYTGSRVNYFQTEEKWLSSSVVTDASLGFGLGPQRLFVRVVNLFDQRYSEQFGYNLNDRDYPGLPRTLIYGMEMRLE